MIISRAQFYLRMAGSALFGALAAGVFAIPCLFWKPAFFGVRPWMLSPAPGAVLPLFSALLAVVFCAYITWRQRSWLGWTERCVHFAAELFLLHVILSHWTSMGVICLGTFVYQTQTPSTAGIIWMLVKDAIGGLLHLGSSGSMLTQFAIVAFGLHGVALAACVRAVMSSPRGESQP